MATISLLYKDEYAINDHIKVRIPTLRDIVDQQDEYYGLVSMFTATPIDMMVQLDDIGVDFTTLNDYDLFLMLFNVLKDRDVSLILGGGLDFKNFQVSLNTKNNMVILHDKTTGAIIDRGIHNQIAATLRKINHLEKDNRKPANAEAKEYMLERARLKMKRNKNRKVESQLESLIVALVNTEQFSYNFETVKDLTIYQFNESARQIIKKIDYDNRMIGVYAGTVNAKDLSQDDLNWLTHK